MWNETGVRAAGNRNCSQRCDREPGALDRGGGVAAEVAAAEQVRPDRGLQQPLRADPAGSAGADVLEEAQRSAGPQHPADLGERGVLVRHGAQHEGHHHHHHHHHHRGVVAGVGGGHPAGRAAGDFDGNGHGPGGGGGESAQPRFGLDRQHPGHRRGVVPKLGPVPAPMSMTSPAMPASRSLRRPAIPPASSARLIAGQARAKNGWLTADEIKRSLLS
jgi:hypothetical protein